MNLPLSQTILTPVFKLYKFKKWREGRDGGAKKNQQLSKLWNRCYATFVYFLINIFQIEFVRVTYGEGGKVLKVNNGKQN